MDNFDNDFNNFEDQPNHELNSKYGRASQNHDSYIAKRQRYNDSEFAAEFASNDIDIHHNATSGALITGAIGIATMIAAMFFYPLVLGVVAMLFGAYSFSRGNKVIGLIALVGGFITAIVPMFINGALFTLF